MSRTASRTIVLTLATILAAAAPAVADDHGRNADPASVRLIASFDPGAGGAFAESIAWAGHDTLVASVNHWGTETEPGVWSSNILDVMLVPVRGGAPTTLQSIDLGPAAMALGVAHEDGATYVAINNFSGDPAGQPATGVLRVTREGVERVMTLPFGATANGLAVVDHVLYVTDSTAGAIWSGPTRTATSPTIPWLTSPLLLPVDDPNLPPIGANGIVYSRGSMLVASWAQGLIVRIPLDRRGTAGNPTVLAQDPLLVEVDGLTLDRNGDLLATVNKDPGALLRIGPRGNVTPVTLPDGTFDYPTQAVVKEDATYVANGSYFNGTPSVIEIHRTR